MKTRQTLILGNERFRVGPWHADPAHRVPVADPGRPPPERRRTAALPAPARRRGLLVDHHRCAAPRGGRRVRPGGLRRVRPAPGAEPPAPRPRPAAASTGPPACGCDGPAPSTAARRWRSTPGRSRRSGAWTPTVSTRRSVPPQVALPGRGRATAGCVGLRRDRPGGHRRASSSASPPTPTTPAPGSAPSSCSTRCRWARRRTGAAGAGQHPGGQRPGPGAVPPARLRARPPPTSSC